ncbi:MAG: serine hydrolase domain-containing protein [Clostridia bacterium]
MPWMWTDWADSFVERVRAEDGTPGVALSVTDRDGVLYSRTYGLSNAKAGEPLLPHHRIEFGSIGKSFTALLLLQLQAEGRLSLEEPVEAYLPWFQVKGRPRILLSHLLSHTSGLIGGTDFPPDAHLEVWSLRHTETVWAPGARFHYANVGFKTLGLVLEAVTGRSYRELVRERLLDPLEMGDTDAVITHEVRRQLADGHRPLYDDRPYWPEDPLVPAAWIETDTADGCLSSTAVDLARYVRLLLNGGRVEGRCLIGPEDFRRFITPVIQVGPDDWYALGIGRYGTGDDAVIGHSGGMLGYYAQILADPASGVGVAVLVNGPGRPAFIAQQVLDAARRGVRGEDPGPEPPVSASLLEEAGLYAGTYRSGSGDTLEITPGALGELRILWNGEPMPPPRASGGAAIVAHHPALSLFLLEREGDDHETLALHHGGDTYWRIGREQDRGRLAPAQEALTGHYRSHNPWESNFRIVGRGRELFLIPPDGASARLLPIDGEGRRFRLTNGDGPLPEELVFDTIVDGRAWGASLAGHPFARFFTP